MKDNYNHGRLSMFTRSAKRILGKGASLSLRVTLASMCTAIITGCHWIGLVSVSSGGVQGTSDAGDYPQISGDGRYVAYSSSADDLVPGDTNARTDVFLYDTQIATTTRVSVATSGLEANASSWINSVSANGRFVLFSSAASNLVENDANATYDAFIHDTHTSVTSRVSVNTSEIEGNGSSGSATIADNGRYVVFSSGATNLVAGDFNGKADVFVADIESGVISLVSVDTEGNQGNDNSGPGVISADGRYIAFESDANNLVDGDTNFERDIFVHDRQTGTTTRVNLDSAGFQANKRSADVSISADGQIIAFRSYADNLVPGDTNGHIDVFVHERQTGMTTRVNVNDAGLEANGSTGHIFFPALSMSADGRFIAFESAAANLVETDTNTFSDIFVHDREAGTTRRLSLDYSGKQGNSYSTAPKISRDGRYVVFNSNASNLVPNDTNGFKDIFIKTVPTPSIKSIFPNHLPIGSTTPVIITGSGFLPDSALWFNQGSVSNLVIVDSNTITADFTIPGDQASGAYDFGVNIFGTGAGAFTGASEVCSECVTLF